MSRQPKVLMYTNVGTDWVEQELPNLPPILVIKRVRAEIQSGTGTEVAVSLREKSNPSSVLDIALEYSLTTSPLDSGEDLYLWSSNTFKNSSNKKAFVAVKVDSGSDTVVKVRIEYEKG